MANDDLPEAVDLTRPKLHNQLVGPRQARVAKVLAEHIRQLPNDLGVIPEEGGDCEFIDPTMNVNKLFDLVTSQFDFPISKRNIEYVISGFFGKLVMPKKSKPEKVAKVAKGALTTEQSEQLSHLPFIAERLESLATAIGKVGRLQGQVDSLLSHQKGEQGVRDSMTRDIEKLKGEVIRLEREKASKPGEALTRAAYSTSTIEAPRSRLAAIRGEREGRLAKFKRTSALTTPEE